MNTPRTSPTAGPYRLPRSGNLQKRQRQLAAGVDLAIRHQTLAGRPETPLLAVRRSLPALPVSAVGLTTRQRRGAGGGHYDVDVYDPERKKVREAATAQQKP